MPSLADHDIASLRAQFAAWGHSATHADKLLLEFYKTAGRPKMERLELRRGLIEKMRRDLPLRRSRILRRQESADGTIKLLVGFDAVGDGTAAEDAGQAVEAVLMPTPNPGRAAGCVSSQIGCAMGCDFCASTRNGLLRNLDAGEIVEQFLHLKEAAQTGGRRLATLVFMGMGEPLQNLENVITAIRRIAGRGMGDLGWRQITVSTVGIAPGIIKLAEADLNVNLALSLHAPDDATRSRIVPLNNRYPVAEIVAATKRFYERTGRVTNIEVCLLDGVNDSDEHARALAALLKGFRTHVNLIPYNAIGAALSGAVYQQPPFARMKQFLSILRAARIMAHLRRTRGDDVNAACGQLRTSKE